MKGLSSFIVETSLRIYTKILLSINNVAGTFELLSILVFFAQYLLYALAIKEDKATNYSNDDNISYEVGPKVAGIISNSTLINDITKFRHMLMHIESTENLKHTLRHIMNQYGDIDNYGTMRDDAVVKHFVSTIKSCRITKDTVCLLFDENTDIDNKRSIGSLLKAAESSK